ncbi:MAG: MASE3 domain-containing protein [Gallionellaceae bacterium]
MPQNNKILSFLFGRGDFSLSELIGGVLLLIGIHLTTYYNYLLFHSFVELFSVIIAFTIFIIAINCWHSIQNRYLLFIGIAYLFVGLIDILHTLSYKGMPVFKDYDYYAPQFWIAARSLESASMLVAFGFLGTQRTLSKFALTVIFGLITSALIASILYFKTFPACFVAGQGLTPFKINMEYAIIATLLISLGMLYRKRNYFDAKIFRLIGWSIVLMIATELSFTKYVSDSMSDAFNELGHLFKIISFYFLYKAIVVTGLADPINLLFGNLKASEERLLEAQQLARLGRWEYFPDKNEWVFSDEIFNFFGLPKKAQPSLHSILDTLQAADQRVLQDAIQRLREKGEPFEVKLNCTVFGGVRFAQMRGRVVRDEEGNLIHLVGTLQDVTDEHRLQEALTVVKDKEKYELLMQTSGDGIHVFDMAGKVVEVNDMFCNMLGYRRDELLKMNVAQWDAKFNPEAMKEKLAENFREANVFETQHRRKDGAIIDVEISAKAITYGGQSVLWNSARDISARKQNEIEMRRSNTELEQFSYAVSHDMRQPLRMISSYLQLLELELADKLDAEKRRYFDYAVDGAKRIDHMLVALLEYSRVGRRGELLTSVDSRAAFEDALLFLQPEIVTTKVLINTTGEWPSIIANQDDLLRLLQNLLGNAIKYRIEGRAPEVTVTSKVTQSEWQLCVADNGVGIIPDQIGRLFKVFQRLQTREAYEGTGVGLALCRKIVEHYKGRIWVESAGEELGSQFYVTLPLRQVAEPLAEPIRG